MNKATLRSSASVCARQQTARGRAKIVPLPELPGIIPPGKPQTRQGHRATRKRGGTDACGRVSKLRRALSWGVTTVQKSKTCVKCAQPITSAAVRGSWEGHRGWRHESCPLRAPQHVPVNEEEFPDGVELSCADYKRLMDFVGSIARLTKDGECVVCGKDGLEDNPECDDHEAWDMPNDDAVETLHSLISQAREIVAVRQ